MHVTLPGRDRECSTGFGNFSQRSDHLSLLFSPRMRGRRNVKTYQAGPTQLEPTNTETSMATTRTTSNRADARCSAEEPTPNKLTMRRLKQLCTYKTTAAATT